MTPQEIEQKAKELGVTPQEVLNPKAEMSAAQEAPKITHIQHVIVALSDGRRGIFAGPMFVSQAELILKPPTIAEVIICQPRPIEEPKEEPKDGNAETKQEGAV